MFAPASSRFRIGALAFALLVQCLPPLIAAKPDGETEEDRDSSHRSLDLKRKSESTTNPAAVRDPLAGAAGGGKLLFAPGEVQFLGFGTGGFGQDTHEATEQHTVTRTRTVTETHLVTQTTYQSVFVPSTVAPGRFVLMPVQTTVPVTTKRQVTTKSTVQTTKNVAAIQGGFGGAGMEARYFFTRMLGVGVEGDWLEGEGSSGTTMTTITARFIKNANAYYVFGGTGVQFDEHHTQPIGKLGVGVEHRFLAGTGVFADAAWMFGSHENAGVFRGGFKFSF